MKWILIAALVYFAIAGEKEVNDKGIVLKEYIMKEMPKITIDSNNAFKLLNTKFGSYYKSVEKENLKEPLKIILQRSAV